MSPLGDIDIGLWTKVKAKATLERKTMREVIFEGLKWHITPVETIGATNKKKKWEKGSHDLIGTCFGYAVYGFNS